MKRGPTCTVCAHPKRAAIESAVGSLDVVAARFSLKRSTLDRHRKHATPPALPPAPADDGKPLELRNVTRETIVTMRRLLPVSPPSDAHKIAGAITQATRLLARLDGQLEISQSQIVRSHPWRQLMDLLDGVLEKHPDAAKDWAAALREVAG